MCEKLLKLDVRSSATNSFLKYLRKKSQDPFEINIFLSSFFRTVAKG